MSLFRKIFGKKPPVTVESVDSTVRAEAACATQPDVTDPSKDPNLMRVHDAYGRELFIGRQQWREGVLPGHLAKVRDNPDALGASILAALRDGFVDAVVEPAEHLARIDSDPERGAVVLSLVYRELKRPADAERVLGEFLAAHGETGMVLVHLAKAQADLGRTAESADTLQRGLELDPNQENGLGWYLALQREQGGEPAVFEALRRIAARPGTWRARLWLARDALQRRELEEALAVYREVLELAPRPVPADLLMQMSGDLGNAAHLPELLNLTAPLFEVERHGLQVGNNLIKAYLDLGRIDEAQALLDRLYACGRHDWKNTLDHWDHELAKLRVATTPVPPEAKVVLAMLHGDGPVWLPPDSPAAELFPTGTGEPARIAFLGSSGETAARNEKVVAQLSDGPGRMSRALPLFLCEQVFFRGCAQVRPLMPWATGDTTAFVFSHTSWPAEEAARQARRLEPPADYVVVTHLKVIADPWKVELRLLRTIDATVLGTLDAAFPMDQPEAALRQLGSELVDLLVAQAGLRLHEPAAAYTVPTGVGFPNYMLRLEQLLSVRCEMADPDGVAHLHGERDIIEGALHLCLAEPSNVVPRLLLAQVLKRLAKVAPHIIAEFRMKIALLQEEHPLDGAAQAVLKRLFGEVYPELRTGEPPIT